MGTMYEDFARKLSNLQERFERDKPTYRKEGYDETTLRLEYLNPLFKALGWDVDNETGTPPHLREVRVEYPTPDGRSSRRADYVFRVNGLDRFVCEAKKFPESLERWHYQVQNYAFNLRLWVAVITNFEEMHLFVVGGKPDREHPFSPAPGWRLYSWEYASEATRIWGLLSKQAVAAGSLENYIQSLPKVRAGRSRQLWLIKPDRTRTVDSEFLRYLETQRARLAKCIVRHNQNVDWFQGGLNEAVQVVLDRLLFQRVCEDRDIDTSQTLSQALSNWERKRRPKAGLWREIATNFINMSTAFNGGLYGTHPGPRHFSEKLDIDDRWLEEFVEHLSADDSPYLFSTIPVEILGSVYERFLGSVVQPNGDVELKPELRKQGGVYYTPQHVVDKIVEETVGLTLRGKEPQQIRKIKILDPACGSGSFLIGAFERICEHYVEYFHENPSRQSDRVTYVDHNGDLRLTTELKRQIARDNIFGVDVDPQAVEVAQMSLYLKILEHETRTTLRRQRTLFPEETFLPDLSRNIRVGNSLIGTDALQLLGGSHDVGSARPFCWEVGFADVMATGGFDCVIGNPPYDVVEKDRGEASWPHDILRAYIQRVDRLDGAKGGKLNLFRFFIVQGLQLVKSDGQFGMIVPMALLVV